MPNHEFENYLALVSRLLRLNRSQKELIRHELRDHLESRIGELVESGTDPDQAVRRALEEFGDAAVLAQKFQTVFQVTQRRWMMRFATFSIAGTFLVAVLVMAMWPSPARFGAPSAGIAQDPFASEKGGNDEDPFGSKGTDSEDPFSADSAAIKTAAAKSARKPVRRIMTSEDLDRKLQEPVDFRYEETPFEEVMDELRDGYRINLLLHQSARDDSLTEDEPITFTMTNVRMATALRLMLQAKNATYLVNDGILEIISLDVAADPEFHRRKIFDCRQLLARIRVAEKDRIGTPISVQRLQTGGGFGGGGGGGGRGGGVFNYLSGQPSVETPFVGNQLSGGGGSGGGSGSAGIGPGNTAETLKTGTVFELVNRQDAEPETGSAGTSTDQGQAESPDKEQLQQNLLVKRVTAEGILIDLIKTSVDPDGWDTTNGDGTLIVVGGFMVVTQTEQTLDEIGDLIAELDRRLKQK